MSSLTTPVSLLDWFPFTFYSVFIVVMNGLVCTIYLKDKRIRETIFNKLIFIQSVVDVMVAIVLIPCYCASKFANGLSVHFVAFLFTLVVVLSFATLLTGSVERYFLLRDELSSVFFRIFKRIMVAEFCCSMLFVLIPGFVVMVQSKTDAKNDVTLLFSFFAIVLVLTMAFVTAIVIGKATYHGSNNLQYKIDKLSSAVNLTETMETHRLIDEHEKRLRYMWKIIVSLSICLILTLSPWIHDTVQGNLLSGISMYVFSLKSLLNPIVILIVIKDYQNTMYKCLGGRRFRSIDHSWK